MRKQLLSNQVDTLKVKCSLGPIPVDPLSTCHDKKVLAAFEEFTISDILYADDTAFIAKTEVNLQKTMDIANRVLVAFGQEISFGGKAYTRRSCY
jgi:hypothetical protein